MIRTRWLAVWPAVLAFFAATATPSRALPPAGFVNEGVVAGLDRPTDLAFLPDGRLLVVGKAGQLWVVNPSANPVTALAYMTLSGVHSSYSESGVMSVVLDPLFSSNGFFYLYYAHAASMRFRVSRFTHNGNSASPASEVVIFTDDQNFTSCCHWGGGLDFGADGKLYLATGDKTDPAGGTATGPQNLNVVAGKLLRMNPDGTAPADNPFFDGAGAQLDTIYARGLRNPFRARFDRPTGRLFIGEVGYVDFEDLHLGRRGANYGWPECEGICTNPAYDDPIFTYPTAPRASITGGFVYRGSLFPAAYGGAYFFADYVRKWIHYVTFDTSGTVPTAETLFESAAGDVVAFAQGPDGALYYLNHSGAVRRIAPGSPEPVGTITLDQASFEAATACTPSTTLTIPGVAVGTQANRILIATIATEQFNNTACDFLSPSVTVAYRGVSMTRAVTAKSNRNQGRACSAIYYLLNPPSGSGNVVVTWPSSSTSSESVERFGAAYVIHGAAQQPPEATAARASETAPNPITTDMATFTERDFVANILLVGNPGSFTPQASGQTELFDLGCTGSSAAGSVIENVAPGVVVPSWQHTNANRFAQSVAAFAPAPIASPSSTTSTSLPVTTTTFPAGEPIALDAASFKQACSGTAGDSLVIPSVPVANRPNRVLVVTVGAEEDNADCNLAHAAVAVTYGGLPMTRAVAALSGTSSWRACNGIFYLHNPPVGTANVNISFPATTGTPIDNRHAAALLLYNVAAGPPEVTKAVGANAKTNPVNTAIHTLTDGAWVIDVMTQGNGGTFTTTQAGQTERWDVTCGTSASATSTKETNPAVNTSLGWRHSSPKRYAHALAAFAPASVVTPTTLPPTTTTPPPTTTTLPAGDPIALDAPSLKHACSGTAGDSLAVPAVPVSDRPNRVLVVTVGGEEDDADCNLGHTAATVTYGALAMTRAVSALSGTKSWRACNGIFYLHDPPVGTADVTISFPATVGTAIDNRHAGAFLLYNVAAGPPQVTKAAGANATTNPVATSIQTPTNGAWVVDVMTQGNAGTFTTTQVGQVERWERSCTSSVSATSTKEVTAATTTLGWSHSAPKRWAHALAVFAPAN